MAQTLLAQVYLQWAGAPVNGGAEYYTRAANMALEVVDGGQHELIQPGGSSQGLNSAYNVIKTTESSNEIIFAKEYDQTSYNVGNSYAVRSIGTDASNGGMPMTITCLARVATCSITRICLPTCSSTVTILRISGTWRNSFSFVSIPTIQAFHTR